MGTVYAAYDPELDRKVALKVLHAEGAAPDSSGTSDGRLLREAQAMARLTHTNVVRIYDVGTVGDRVFLAMEFIDGVTLGYWMKQGRRSWSEVLGPFSQAGRGLAAAHAAGLVHRDFKPDNVLIASDGRVLVSDFGIAREAGHVGPPAPTPGEHRPLARAPFDGTGLLVGTPEYMAPEQCLGHHTDARTDQFSFCVCLCEALTGARPFTPEQLSGPLDTSAAARVAQAHGMPGRLWKVLARGLSRDPAQRFPSMDALLSALERHDLVRTRRRRVVTSALAGGLALAVGGAWALNARQSLLCTGAERKLAGVWDTPRQEAVRGVLLATGQPYSLAAWQAVQRGFDTFSSRWTAMHTEACEATRLRGEQSEQILTLRMFCLERRLKQARALGDILAAADAEVVQRAGDIAGALPDLSECADAGALAAAVPPPADPAVREQVGRLREQVARASALTLAGRYTEARALAREAVDAARPLKYPPLEAEALLALGDVLDFSGEPSAEQVLLEAAWAAEADRNDEVAAQAWTTLVYVGGVSLDKPESAQLYASGARAALARLGDRPRLRAALLNNLGGMAFSQARYAQALEYHHEAATLREQALGPESPELTRSLFNLANVHFRQARYEEAHALLRRVLALQEKILGAEHPALVLTLNTLGSVWLEQGRFTEALPLFERARRLSEQTYGSDNPRVTLVLGNLGSVLRQLGRPGEALVLQQRAHELRRRAWGEEHPQTALAGLYLALTLGDLGRLEEARRMAGQALTVSQAKLGPEHPQVAFALQCLGELAQRSREWRRALEYYEKSAAISEKALGPRHPSLVPVLTGLGRARLELKDAPGALATLERAVSLGQEVSCEPQALAEARLTLARTLVRAGREPQRAQELAQRARKVFAAQPTLLAREHTAEADALMERLTRASP
jgi:tetratricopeptide (TPR) repeat protein